MKYPCMFFPILDFLIDMVICFNKATDISYMISTRQKDIDSALLYLHCAVNVLLCAWEIPIDYKPSSICFYMKDNLYHNRELKKYIRSS